VDYDIHVTALGAIVHALSMREVGRGWWAGPCPWHPTKGGDCLNVNAEKFLCLGCQRSGTAEELRAKVTAKVTGASE
jgi:hypothetical protein